MVHIAKWNAALRFTEDVIERCLNNPSRFGRVTGHGHLSRFIIVPSLNRVGPGRHPHELAGGQSRIKLGRGHFTTNNVLGRFTVLSHYLAVFLTGCTVVISGRLVEVFDRTFAGHHRGVLVCPLSILVRR